MPRLVAGKELRAAIRKQVRIGVAMKGKYQNEAAPFIVEYVTRKRLAALGMYEPLSEVDCITAEAMMFIEAEYASLEVEKAAKQNKGKSKGRRT